MNSVPTPRKKPGLLKRAWRKLSARQLLRTDGESEPATPMMIEEKDDPTTPPPSPNRDVLSLRLSETVELAVSGIRECTYSHRDHATPCLHDVRLSMAQSSGCRARMPMLTAQNSYAIYRLLRQFDADTTRVMEGHFGRHDSDERAGRYNEMLTHANRSALCLQMLGTHQRRSKSHASCGDFHALYDLGSLEQLPSRPQSPASAPGSARERSREDADDGDGDIERGFLAFPKTLHGSPSWEILSRTSKEVGGKSVGLHETTDESIVL